MRWPPAHYVIRLLGAGIGWPLTTPTNHHLTVIIPDGKQMRGQVITVKQLGPGVATLVVELPDLLPYGEYEATYATPSQEAAGTFKVFQFSVSNNYRWRASGIFTRAKERSAGRPKAPR